MKNQSIEEFLGNKIYYNEDGNKYSIPIKSKLNANRVHFIINFIKIYKEYNKQLYNELVKLFPEYMI